MPAYPPTPPGDDPTTHALAQAARKLLVREGGGGKSSQEVAAGAAQAWKKMSQHLSRLVGEGGVRALFDRSLTLTCAQFPWLVSAAKAAPSDPPWNQLRTCLETQDPDVGIEASVVLVITFVRLLGKFIGEALAVRLFHEVWPEIAPTTPKETT
jgi:hypothetical protein